jgi:hypothetical protein
MRLSLGLVILCALAGSCRYGIADISGVPDNPTYDRDIYPLFRDHCLLCHGSPPNRGAKGTFRLDAYDDAVNWSSTILYEVNTDKMPPAAKEGDGVGPNGKAMLQKWVDNGTPK